MTAHSIAQARNRLVQCGYTSADIARMFEHVAAQRHLGDTAYLLDRLPVPGGQIGQSNGEHVWFIVRGGVVTTVMLRRADQPHSGLRVDYVVDLTR